MTGGDCIKTQVEVKVEEGQQDWQVGQALTRLLQHEANTVQRFNQQPLLV